MPFRANSPINGLYNVQYDEQTDIFTLFPLEKGQLRICKRFDDVEVIITEAAVDKSEYSLINSFLDQCNKNILLFAAGGKDRISIMIRKLKRRYSNRKILILMVLANVSSQYERLIKACRENPNIWFYPYMCFEQLMIESFFVSQIGLHFPLSKYDFITLEVYYERYLEFLTRDTEFPYSHSKPSLDLCYLKDCCIKANPCKYEVSDKMNAIFDSPVGNGLFELLTGKNTHLE